MALTQPVTVAPRASGRGSRTPLPVSHGSRSVSESTSRLGGNAPPTGWSSASVAVIRVRSGTDGSAAVCTIQVRRIDPSRLLEVE